MITVGILMTAGIVLSVYLDRDGPKGDAPSRPINNSTTKNVAVAIVQKLFS